LEDQKDQTERDIVNQIDNTEKTRKLILETDEKVSEKNKQKKQLDMKTEHLRNEILTCIKQRDQKEDDLKVAKSNSKSLKQKSEQIQNSI